MVVKSVSPAAVSQTNGHAPSEDDGSLERLHEAALEHVWIHSTTWSDVVQKDGLKVFARGEGVRLWDIHGKEYLDGISGLWVVNAGHGRAEIGEAMAEQAGKLAYVSAINYTTVPAVAAGRQALPS